MAKVLVGVKRVIDYDVPIRIRPDKKGVETYGVPFLMNPFDEIAVEEAVQMKTRKEASNIIAVSCGPPKAEETLRNALAMGADSAIHIEVPEPEYEKLEPIHISKMLAKIAQDEKVDIVLLGKQAVDDDCNQTAQMTAAYLGWPQGTFASKVEKTDDELKVTREIDGGFENIKLKIPAVLSADLRLNDPRYVSLQALMKAKKKPIKKLSIADLGVDVTPHQEVISIEDPPEKEPGPILPDVDTLLAKLREAKIL